MKKLLFALAASAVALAGRADFALAEYDQVAGVSNQVGAVDARLSSVALDVEAIKGIVVGGESASPYLGGIRVTFNTGENASVPEGEEYVKALAGAHLTIQAPNERYTVPVTDITAGAVKQVFIPCDNFVDVGISLSTGPAKYLYSSGSQIVHVRQGQIVDVGIDTLPPLSPPSEKVEELRQFGRAQYYDPENTYGKRDSGVSFPIQRVWDVAKEEWVTQLGYYSNNVWVTECDVYNEIPQLDSTGGFVNEPELTSGDGLFKHAYEVRAFPWNEAERVAVTVDSSMLNSNGQANPATNLFYFTRVPIYAYKESIETLTITNYAANGTVSSATEYPMQIHWVAKPEITNGYDLAYHIPSWEKVYVRDCTTNANDEVEWSTRCLGVKEANYYACYKSAPCPGNPSSDHSVRWRMAGSDNYVIQSYPWGYRDSSNYGVAKMSRAAMNSYAHKLNPYAITMSHLRNGTEVGEAFAAYSDPTGTEMEKRRWAGNTWHDYQAFRELAYIQFGANAQSTGNEIANGLARCIGIVGNNTTSVAQARQDDLELYFAAQTNLLTFTIAPRAANGYSFAWLGVLNFWGSEGDQMADVTTVAETDADGTKSIWYLACLDRSLFLPDSSGTATDYSRFPDQNGYEKLSYYWAYTGLPSGTFYRGKDTKADYAAFNLVRTTPQTSTDLFAVNLSSSPYDAVYAPSSYPAVPASGSAYSYWMCSLSSTRNYAIGPWFVYANTAPSYAHGHLWGARPSLNILAAEGGAQSGGE